MSKILNFDLQKVVDSKAAYREKLSKLPVAEKMRMLDTLREESVALRKAGALYLKQTGAKN
jgi:hypothetical protein